MKRNYTRKAYKGSGFFNRCFGKKCNAESPRKTPRNNTITVKNPMLKNVTKRVEKVIKNNNNLSERDKILMLKLEKAIKNTENNKEIYGDKLTRKNRELFNDQIVSYKQGINFLKTKNATKVSKNLLNSIKKREKEFIEKLKRIKKEEKELLNELNSLNK